MVTEAAVRFRPIGARVLVLPAPAQTKIGNIIIPDNAKEKQQKGHVVALGTGRLLESGERSTFEVEEAQEILFKRYAGNEIEIDGESYIVLEESDILGIL